MDGLGSSTSAALNCGAFWMEAYVCTNQLMNGAPCQACIVFVYMDTLNSQNKVQQTVNLIPVFFKYEN